MSGESNSYSFEHRNAMLSGSCRQLVKFYVLRIQHRWCILRLHVTSQDRVAFLEPEFSTIANFFGLQRRQCLAKAYLRSNTKKPLVHYTRFITTSHNDKTHISTTIITRCQSVIWKLSTLFILSTMQIRLSMFRVQLFNYRKNQFAWQILYRIPFCRSCTGHLSEFVGVFY